MNEQIPESQRFNNSICVELQEDTQEARSWVSRLHSHS